MKKYDPSNIEPKWQQVWADTKVYAAKDNDASREKYYYLVEFPYPSGDGLHVGHVLSYTALDIMSRHKRMQGYNVLYPIGFDEFGLPTENYAIKHKIAPQVATERNVGNFRRQLRALGISFDWDREVRTADPNYYKWTQWIFLKLLEKGLAYQAELPINWCPFEKTGLANEEVVDGKHERCGTPVEKKLLKQWVLKITAYADRLVEDLKSVDYLDRIATQQINWIGRKDGINITYGIANANTTEHVTCFTTRPDTNFGATFVVIAPEHPLAQKVASGEVAPVEGHSHAQTVRNYIQKSLNKSEIERQEEGRKKTGAFTGLYAENLLNGRRLPIYVADFVLAHFGTGAVVGVPGHDLRDFEFAKEFNLPIERVVVGPTGDTSPITSPEQVQEKAGTMVNSEFLNGLDIHEATKKIKEHMEEQGYGKRVVSYRLRDWIFSRQHYWGEPIPVVHCAKDGVVPVPVDQLPVELPKVDHYEPTDTGESPLAAITDWVNTQCPKCGGPAKRETDTMPNWAGSSWYFLRYTDPHNTKEFASPKNLKYWTPVDLYNGGMEHTTLHLLYSRFWHKFLYDEGLVPTPEPYARRRSHGMILGPDGQKMSKSKGNVINPDHVVEKYGADTIRLYEMFMGPFDEVKAWSEDHLNGVSRFIYRVWTWFDDMSTEVFELPASTGYESNIGAFEVEVDRMVHKTLKKVHEDIEAMHFNTAVSAMMELMNFLALTRTKQLLGQENAIELKHRTVRTLVLMLAPFTPHLTEEIWHENLGEEGSVHVAGWPKYDPELIKDDVVTIVVQVNGKLRGSLAVPADATDKEVTAAAQADPNVARHLDGKAIVKTIVVPRRIVNFVVKD